VGVLHFSK